MDRIQQQYLAKEPNIAYSADITLLNKNIYLFLIIDLGSRLIIAHSIQDQDFTTEDVINVLLNSLVPRSNAKSVIFHTDNGSQFSSKAFEEFAQVHNIKLSKAPPKKAMHGNQVSERLNRTLKGFIRRKLVLHLDPTQDKPYLAKQTLKRLLDLTPFTRLVGIVHNSVEDYNNTPHRNSQMYALAPFHVDEAFYRTDNLNVKDINYNSVPNLAFNNNDTSALAIKDYRAHVVQKFAINWQEFFFNWKKQNNQYFFSLAEQNHKLYEQNRQLEKKLYYLVEREQEREKAEQLKAFNKAKRDRAKKSQ